MADAALPRIHQHAAGGVAGQAGFREEGWSQRVSGPQCSVGLEETAVGQRQPPVNQRTGADGGRQLDPGINQRSADHPARPGWRGCQRLLRRGHQHEMQPAAKAARQGQDQLDSGGVVADDGQAGAIRQGGFQCGEPGQKASRRADRDTAVRRVRQGRLASEIDRQEVELQGWAAGQFEAAGGEIEANGLGQEQPCAGRHSQPGEIGMGVGCRELTADQGGQSAGVWGIGFGYDQRQADGRRWTQGEAAQHLEMAGAGSQQDDVDRQRAGGWHGHTLQGLSRVAVRVRMPP
jgi:hypothetical protein